MENLHPGWLIFSAGWRKSRLLRATKRAFDLIVASDSMNAHLAGALGRPTCVALRRVPDWRWLLGRDDCPWYPSMRLFRQKTPGDWPGVFERMATLLRGQGDALPAVRSHVAQALRSHLRDGVIALPTRAWLISARAE